MTDLSLVTMEDIGKEIKKRFGAYLILAEAPPDDVEANEGSAKQLIIWYDEGYATALGLALWFIQKSHGIRA